jgi:hypothetical protein
MFEKKNTTEYKRLTESADTLINSQLELISLVEMIDIKV